MALQCVPLICIHENIFVINLKVVLNTVNIQTDGGSFEENTMGLIFKYKVFPWGVGGCLFIRKFFSTISGFDFKPNSGDQPL